MSENQTQTPPSVPESSKVIQVSPAPPIKGGIAFDYLSPDDIRQMTPEDAQRMLNKRNAEWNADPNGNPRYDTAHAQHKDATIEYDALNKVIYRDTDPRPEYIQQMEAALKEQEAEADKIVEESQRDYEILEGLGYEGERRSREDIGPGFARCLKMQRLFAEGGESNFQQVIGMIREDFGVFKATAAEQEALNAFVQAINSSGNGNTVFDGDFIHGTFQRLFTALKKRHDERDKTNAEQRAKFLVDTE